MRTSIQIVRTVLLGFLLFLLPANLLALPTDGSSWQIIKGQHFIIYLQGNDLFLGQKTLQEAERLYDRIASSLGYFDRSGWLWENRCAIYLYQNRRSYIKGAQRPAWSNASSSFGSGNEAQRSTVKHSGAVPRRQCCFASSAKEAEPRTPIIQASAESETFLAAELPHEIAHLVFRQFVGVNNSQVPLWLDEGVALWQEKLGARAERLEGIVRQAASERRLISLSSLSGAQETNHLPTWASQQSISIFYAESFSLVKFLISRYGEARFAEFVRHLKNGDTLEESMRGTYGSSFRNLSSLEYEWQHSLEISGSA